MLHARILAWVRGEQWAIDFEWLRFIDTVVSGNFSALEKVDGTPLSYARTAYVRGDVAVIPVLGPIVPRADMFTDVCGLTSTESVMRDMEVARQNPDIARVVLTFDTPGGAVTGVDELADYIRKYDKPVDAHGSGSMASAGYWIAASCDRIFVTPTTVVGSIGVVSGYRKTGDDSVTVVSSQSPKKRLVGESQKEALQVLLDDTADVFIADVAAGRKVSVDTVLSDFGEGGVMIAAKALECGMVDGIMSFEEFLESISGGLASVGPTTNIGEGVQAMDIEQLKAEHTSVYDAVLALGAASVDLAGAKAEIAALQDKLAVFEREEAVRAAKAMEGVASNITNEQLAASVIPEHLHGKVRAAVPYTGFINDGKFDADAFSVAFKAEVDEWSRGFEKHSVDGGSTIGAGAIGGGHNGVDAAVDSLLAHIQ